MPPNVLLLVVDCLRYDHVRLFERTLALLEPSVWFSNAWSTGPMSDGNFASILTGMHPDTHGVLTQCMDTDLPTLPQALGEADYHTFGASVKYPDGVPQGLSDFYRRGFQKWMWLSWGTFMAEGAMERIMALREPWFAMLRPMDLHEPAPGKYNYEGCIADLDSLLERLLNGVLKSHSNTVVVLTADHGQGLGERGMWHHRMGLWWFLTHVPVVLSHSIFRPQECSALFQHMDLTATIANLCGVDFQCEGIDWSEYLTDANVPDRIRQNVVMYSMGSERKMLGEYDRLWRYRAVRTYFWSYYESRRWEVMGDPELYSTLCDPREDHNLVDSKDLADKMESLKVLLDWPDGDDYTSEEEELVLERLRAIGYAE